MAITVRYPNGQSLTYSDANFLTRGNNGEWVLSTKNPDEGGTKIAFIQASAGVIVEFYQALYVSNPINGQTPETALRIVQQHLRTLPCHKVAGLKQQLRAFNAKRHCWST